MSRWWTFSKSICIYYARFQSVSLGRGVGFSNVYVRFSSMIFGYLLRLSLKEGHIEGERQGIRFEFHK